MSELQLEEYSPEGSRKLLGTVVLEETVVGREPGHGITVERGSISRRHGVFFRGFEEWFYKDLGSTNGSWINGKQLYEGDICHLRSGDRVQLADTFIQCTIHKKQGIRNWDDTTSDEGPIVAVMKQGKPYHVYTIPANGQVLRAAQQGVELPLDGFFENVPRLVIERKQGQVIAKVSELGISEPITNLVKLNGRQLEGSAVLDDRDVLIVADYIILVSIPKPRAKKSSSSNVLQGSDSISRTANRQTEQIRKETVELPVHSTMIERTWGEEPVEKMSRAIPRRGTSSFGQVAPLQKAEKDISLTGGDIGSSARRYLPNSPSDSLFRSKIDFVVVMIGFLVLLTSFALLIWYLLV